MMRQMRENTKWIMLITALAFVALMVFEWGMDLSGRSAGALTGGELGRVNGDPVLYEEYMTVYRNLYDQRQQQQQTPITSSQNSALEDQAWEQLVTERLIEQELERRDLGVTNEEIRQAARFAPPPEFYSNELFQTDGQFDLSKYQQFLATSAGNVDLMRQLEAYYRNVLPRNKLFQQLAASVVVTDDDLWRAYRERTETATIRYIAMDPTAILSAAEVTIPDGEIAVYYNEHRDEFERPAEAEVELVAISKAPTPADTAAVRARVDSLLAALQAGADFAEMAERESDDEVSAVEGGDLGAITRGQTVPAFEQAVWSAPVGEITGPVQTPFGYHILRVAQRTEEEADVHHILVELRRTLESEDTLFARVDSLEAMVERMPLADAAGEIGLSVRTSTLSPQLTVVPGVGVAEEGVDWAFDQALVGEVSEIFETPSHYYVMELRQRREARPLTLEEATPTIRSILTRERQRERAREVGRELVDQIRGAGATLAGAAQELDAEVSEAGPFTRLDFVPGIGGSNPVIGAAFGLPIGAISDLVETESGVYIIEVVDRTPADRETFEEQKDQLRAQLVQARQRQRIDQFMAALRDGADIADNRDEVLQPADEQQQLPFPSAPF